MAPLLLKIFKDTVFVFFIQDIGLQGYSTLHCIRFAAGVRNVDVVAEDMGSIKLDQVASNLGTIQGSVTSDSGELERDVYKEGNVGCNNDS